MLRIAVVEDDKTYAAQLKEYLARYGTETNHKINVTLFPDGEDIVTEYSADFDIILMDVEMTFMDGMTAAEKIREKDSEVVIIFITNMPQYAIQGYRVDALDYVLKPISYFAFSQRIDRALTRVKKKETNYIAVAQKGGKKKLDVDKICYVEVRDHDLIYHSTDGDVVTKGSMKEAEDALDETKFFRCNRCYLVNLEYVEDFHGSDVTVASDVIQVSRARKKAFLDALNDYMNEVGR
nr:LytTR family DNA-binding domain-containing protein [uncultured Mediterraneibacter sp.]